RGILPRRSASRLSSGRARLAARTPTGSAATRFATGLAASAGRLAAEGFSATRLAAEGLVAARTCGTRTLAILPWPAITPRLVAERAISPGRTFTTIGTVPEGALALETAAPLVASRGRRFGANPVAVIVGAVDDDRTVVLRLGLVEKPFGVGARGKSLRLGL